MKYSLLIGMGQVNPAYYGGWNGKLTGTIPDAKLTEKKLINFGFTNDVLLNEKATISNLRLRLDDLAKKTKSGDIVTLFYSGHGGREWDTNNDEKDDFDETWCLWDGQVIDDIIYEHLLKFKKGVKVFILSDSCHSGSVYKAQLPILRPKTKNKGIAKLKCTLKHFGGCQDDQYSLDLGTISLFTKTFWEIVDDNPNIIPKDLALEMKKVMPKDQQPTYINDGPQILKWDLSPIFR
jgi:hypothetical protein